MKEGIVVLGHGSRGAVDEANQFLVEVTEALKAIHPESSLEPAWMNPRTPRQKLPEAVAKLAAQGVERIIVLPVFLTAGLHLKEDIPEMLVELSQKYPGISFTLARPIGFDPRLVDILADRLAEVRG
ncbi:sirohydrochlorin chelatase [Ammonifex thiophilus]|uniref:Cobalamin biosynthesis protein CbiX n=1 Tax=Ammonifex thiophilus TaxID=444093 RepID=A0A3D8P401_9THEO|nr:CbiX/SirB N-terminal domain-containing protein [Ammonifex thiophilus]RDV83625.1 cobalamin biosynthesis protein CbiX [Ammonifex thiophilus]